MTCGAQRSAGLLFEGNILDSILLFPALIPLILTVILLFSHLFFQFKQGARFITISFVFSAALILVNFLAKSVALFVD
jgi:hypothetical protein